MDKGMTPPLLSSPPSCSKRTVFSALTMAGDGGRCVAMAGGKGGGAAADRSTHEEGNDGGIVGIFDDAGAGKGK